jgi:hypothetical protein
MAFNVNRLSQRPYHFGVFLNSEWDYVTLDTRDTLEDADYFAGFQQLGGKPGDKIHVLAFTTAIPDPITPLDGAATPLSGSGSIAYAATYFVKGVTAAGAAVVGDDMSVVLTPADE